MQCIHPYNWMKEVSLYNKRMEKIPPNWLIQNADYVVILFSKINVDINGIVKKFYEIYESFKTVNIPVEVINVPLDDNEKDMIRSYERQANWFTLKFDDAIIPVLKFMYEVTCLPYILVLKIDGTVISNNGIADLEQYGKNAVITWMTTSASMKTHRDTNKETHESRIYGDKWEYVKDGKEYKRKFSGTKV